MFWETIESLRKKPKSTRNAYAFWSAFLFSLFIMVLWVTSLSPRLEVLSSFGKPPVKEVATEVAKSKETKEVNEVQTVKPLSPTVAVKESESLGAKLQASVVGAWQQISGLFTKAEYTTIETVPTTTVPVWQPTKAEHTSEVSVEEVLIATTSSQVTSTPSTTENMLQ